MAKNLLVELKRIGRLVYILAVNAAIFIILLFVIDCLLITFTGRQNPFTYLKNRLAIPPRDTYSYLVRHDEAPSVPYLPPTVPEHKELDSWGLRRTTNQTQASYPYFLLMMGDSFTLGQGITHDATTASILQKRMPEFRVYNHGTGGSHPGAQILRFRAPESKRSVLENKGVAIFVIIDGMVNRAVGSIETANYISHYPKFVATTNQLQYVGTFFEHEPVWAYLKYQIAASPLLRPLLPVKSPLSTEQFNLFCRMLQELQFTLKQTFPLVEFHAVLYPSDSKIFARNNCLANYEVSYTDYSALERPKKFRTHPDGWHPTKAENEWFSDLLLRNVILPLRAKLDNSLQSPM